MALDAPFVFLGKINKEKQGLLFRLAYIAIVLIKARQRRLSLPPISIHVAFPISRFSIDGRVTLATTIVRCFVSSADASEVRRFETLLFFLFIRTLRLPS